MGGLFLCNLIFTSSGNCKRPKPTQGSPPVGLGSHDSCWTQFSWTLLTIQHFIMDKDFKLIKGGESSEVCEENRALLTRAVRGLDLTFTTLGRFDEEALQRVRSLLTEPVYGHFRTLFTNYHASDPSHVRIVLKKMRATPLPFTLNLEQVRPEGRAALDRLLLLASGGSLGNLSADVLYHLRGHHLNQIVLDYVLLAIEKNIFKGQLSMTDASACLQQLYAFFCFLHGIMYDEIKSPDLDPKGALAHAYQFLSNPLKLAVKEALAAQAELQDFDDSAFLNQMRGEAHKLALAQLSGADSAFVERAADEKVSRALGRAGEMFVLEMDAAQSARGVLEQGLYRPVVDRLITNLIVRDL